MKFFKVLLIALFLTTSSYSAFAEDFLTLNGKKLTDEQLISGNDKTVWLFWTTWCRYCATQLKYIKKRVKKLNDAGIDIYLVNTGEAQNKVMKFAQKHNLPQDIIVLNKNQSLAAAARIMGFPTYLVLYKGAEAAQINNLDDEAIEKLIEAYGELDKQK